MVSKLGKWRKHTATHQGLFVPVDEYVHHIGDQNAILVAVFLQLPKQTSGGIESRNTATTSIFSDYTHSGEV